MLYSEYEQKVTNIAKKFAFVKRNRIPFVSTIIVLLAFLFSFLGVSGIIQSDMVLKRDTFTYGEAITYDRAKAFVSSPHYEYASDTNNPTWSSVVPTLVGDYQVRTYTYNGYRVKRYGETKKFRIVPKNIKLTISNTSITYGEDPFTNAVNELVGTDKIDNLKINYENIFSLQTNATIDLDSIRIVNDAGVDVTSSYSIETETKNVRILKRAITLSSNSVSREYDGTEIRDNSVKITSGSLASGDYFPTQPTTTSSTMFALTTNRITPTISELKVYNVNNVDVTSLYSFTYNEGSLSATKRPLKIVGPEYSSIYNGTSQRAPIDTYNASNLSVSGLASGDRITDVVYNTNSIYTGETPIAFSYNIVNSNGESVLNRYDSEMTIRKFKVTKKDLHVSLNVVNTGSSSMTSTTSSGDIKETYTKEYDGRSINYSVSQSNPDLCSGDSLIGPASSYTSAGEYTPNPTFTVYKNYTSYNRRNVTEGYNIIYNKARIVINKRNLKVEVDDLDLYSCSTSLVGNLVSYRITSGSLVDGDNISFVAKNSQTINHISEGTHNLLDYYNLNLTNRSNYNDDIIVTNSPKLTIIKSKLHLNLNDYSKVYNGYAQEARADYSNNQITVRNDSIIPSNVSYNNLYILSRLTDVERHNFNSNDITFSASYTYVSNQNGSNRSTTLTLHKGDVDFYLYDNYNSDPYFEITKKPIDVTFNPPIKYYDGKSFDPSVLINASRYTINSGSLISGHRFKFDVISGISNVGIYNSGDLFEAYSLKIVDNNNNDKTNNYDLSYTFNDLEIKRAEISLTLKSSSTRITSTPYTYGNLFNKTYNDEETSSFNRESNDYYLNYYSSSYTVSQNISSNYTYGLDVELGIDPAAKDAGTYDVKIKSFNLVISDIYLTNITDKSLVDISITNGSNAYEIKKKTLNFQIPNLTYIRDGRAVDYNFELDTSGINLLAGHSIQITGNEIKEVGTYTAADLNLSFKIYDFDGVDVTSNYTLGWSNRSSFRLTVEEVRLNISRDITKQIEGYRRTYDGTALDETNFYSSISSPNVSNDSKHTYSYTIETSGDLPDNYYDAGVYEQTQNDIPSRYSKVYCTKTYSTGEEVKFEVTNVDYDVPSNPQFLVITDQKVLNITIDDVAYWIGESEYSFDYSKKRSSVIFSDNALASGDYIKDITIRENNGIRFDRNRERMEFNVADYQDFFSVTIYNDTRNKDVTANYDINISGTIVYKKPSISLTPKSINDVYDGHYKNVGSCNSIADLPFGATFKILYNFTLSDGTVIPSSEAYQTKNTETISYTISDVTITYEGEDISSYCDIDYSPSDVATHVIEKASVTFNTGNFELGLGFIWDLALPKTSIASMGISAFDQEFIVEFGFLHDDENGLFTVDSNGYVKVLREGETTNQIRDVKIFDSSGDDVTSNFDINWIIGTIRAIDIGINS